MNKSQLKVKIKYDKIKFKPKMATIRKMEEKPQKEVRPEFVPGKSYKWEPTDEFIFKGEEFATIYNGIAVYVNTEAFQKAFQEAQRTMQIFNAYQVLQDTFTKGIQEGIIYEMTSEKQKEAVETASE